MPSFSLLKRIGREFSNSQQRQEQQQEVQQGQDRSEAPPESLPLPPPIHANGSAKSIGTSPAAIAGSAVVEDSDHDSGVGGVGGVGGSGSTTPGGIGEGKVRKERRNSKRDLLLRMIGKPPITPLRGRTESLSPTLQRSTTLAVSLSQGCFFALIKNTSKW